jgi:hypothetical protein
MPDKNQILTKENLDEWMHSTGYLLPRTPLELARFELLHKGLSHSIDYNKVDPLAIISGKWQMRHIVSDDSEDVSGTINELRMAARKHTALPDEIIRKIRKNNLKKDGSDFPDGKE